MYPRQIGIPSLKPAVKYCLLVIINSPILCIVSVNNENIISALVGCVNDVKSGRWERLRTKITVYYINEYKNAYKQFKIAAELVKNIQNI